MEVLIKVQDGELTHAVTDIICTLAETIHANKTSGDKPGNPTRPLQNGEAATVTLNPVPAYQPGGPVSVPTAPVVPITPAPVNPTPPTSGTPTNAPSNAGAGARTYTLVEIRAASAAAKKRHGIEPIRAILTEFGATGLTALSPELYGAFMSNLEALDNA
jgi:hypothetical protein